MSQMTQTLTTTPPTDDLVVPFHCDRCGHVLCLEAIKPDERFELPAGFRPERAELVFHVQEEAEHNTRWWPEERAAFEGFVVAHPRKILAGLALLLIVARLAVLALLLTGLAALCQLLQLRAQILRLAPRAIEIAVAGSVGVLHQRGEQGEREDDQHQLAHFGEAARAVNQVGSFHHQPQNGSRLWKKREAIEAISARSTWLLVRYSTLASATAVEATVFAFTLQPTLNEVFAGLTGFEPNPRVMAPLLWMFLFMLIAGSFAAWPRQRRWRWPTGTPAVRHWAARPCRRCRTRAP